MHWKQVNEERRMQMSGPFVNTAYNLGVTLKWYNALHLKEGIKRSPRDVCINKGIFKFMPKNKKNNSTQVW